MEAGAGFLASGPLPLAPSQDLIGSQWLRRR